MIATLIAGAACLALVAAIVFEVIMSIKDEDWR
jgi:hypothetical protein